MPKFTFNPFTSNFDAISDLSGYEPLGIDLHLDQTTPQTTSGTFTFPTVNFGSTTGVKAESNNGILTLTGMKGDTLDFNGTTDYVSVSNDSVNNAIYGSTAFSVEAWFKADTIGEGSSGRILDKGDGTTVTKGWKLQLSTGTVLNFCIGNGTVAKDTTTSTTIAFGSWVHAVATWEGIGTAPKIYINGTEASYTTNQTPAVLGDDTPYPLYIGNNSGGTARSFDGEIGTVRIYRNIALTPTQVTALYEKRTVSGATGEYLFTEGTGATLGDTGIGNNDGTISGATWIVPTHENLTIDFEGTADEVIIGSGTSAVINFQRNTAISTVLKAGTSSTSSVTTTGGVIDFNVGKITSGTGLDLSSAFTGTSGITLFSTGNLLNLTTGNVTINPTSYTMAGNLLSANRTITYNKAANTLTVSGAVADIQDTWTLTAGSITHTAPVLNLVENYTGATGAVLQVTGKGTGKLIDLIDNTTSVFSVADGGNVTTASKISTYNNIVTEGYGVPAIVDHVALTGQSASIGTTNFTNAGTAGLYRVNYYLEATTLNVGATSVLATFGWTDDAGATTTVSATLVLTALGRTSGIFYVQLASGNLTYATTLVDATGLARYALYCTVERLN